MEAVICRVLYCGSRSPRDVAT